MQDFAASFDGIWDFKSFAEVTSHRLFDLDMLAGVHCVHGDLGVPVIHRGDGNGIDVISLEQLVVFVVTLHFDARVVFFDVGLGALDAFLPDVTDSGLNDVVFARVRFLGAHVRHALPAHADVADDNAVIGPNHPAGGGSGALPVNRRLEKARGRDSRGGSGGFFDETPARITAGR